MMPAARRAPGPGRQRAGGEIQRASTPRWSHVPARRLWPVYLLVVLLVPTVAATGGIPPSAGGAHGSLPSAAPAGPALESSPTFPTSIRHVVTILLENENAGTVALNGPFERYLASKYGYASSYYSVCHPSAPNYLAITSGSSFQCGSDRYATYDSTNVADLVQNAGLTWGDYNENMSTPCQLTNSNGYVVRHNPFLYYDDIVDNASRCNSHVLNFTAWSNAVSSDDVPNYAFITPDVWNDGHNSNVSVADNWLQGWLSPLLNDTFAQSTVFFITYDESGNSNLGYDGVVGGQVYFAAVGPAVIANSTYSLNASHYDLLTTTEWLLGLGHTGHNDTGSTFPPMKSLFATSLPESYAVEGVVRSNSSGLGVPGANVTAEGGGWNLTNSSGGYRLELANGSYTLTASAPGFVNATAPTVVDGQSVVKDFSLTTAYYPVTGSVTNLSSGAPISGSSLSIQGTVVATTNASGGFTFLLSDGTYSVSASATGYRAEVSPVLVSSGATSANFALSPVGATSYNLSGVVMYASDRSPAPGVTIELDSANPQITAANGTFRFEVPNGTYQLSATASGFFVASESVTIRGASASESLFLASSHLFTLAGAVFSNSSGLPLSGAVVRLNASDEQTTGSLGKYSFLVPNGTYDVQVTDAGFGASNVNVTIDGSSPANLAPVYLIPVPPVTPPVTPPAAAPAPLLSIAELLILAVVVIGAIGGGVAILVHRSRSRAVSNRTVPTPKGRP